MADANALTLADYAMQSNDEAVKGLVKAILTPESILNDIPLITNSALKASVLRLLPDGLPATFSGWGEINKNPNVYKATFEDYQEAVYLVRQLIQVDRRLMAAPNWIGDPFEMQLMAWKNHLNYELNTTFIENNPATGNGDAWTGLRPRMTMPYYKVPAKNNINAQGLNLGPSMTDADAQMLIEWLSIMLSFTGAASMGGSPVFYTNYLTKARIDKGLRQTHMWKYTDDNFGRTISQFQDAKVRDLGWRQDSDTPVVPLNLAADGTQNASSDTAFTEIFLVRYGNETFRGWQTNNIGLEYLGRSTETGVYENAVIDWGVGLMQPHPRAICRLYNVRLV